MPSDPKKVNAMSILIKNATIVTMGSAGIIERGSLVIDGTRITSIGSPSTSTFIDDKTVDEVLSLIHI